MLPDELKSFFPYNTVRKSQDRLIEDIHKVFKEKTSILAHAPTGLGKTISALAVAVYHALEHNKKIFFLTNRHTQHQIAVETLKLIKKNLGAPLNCVDLIGKRWMCNQEIANLFGNDFNEFCRAVVEKGECEFYNNIRTKKGFTVESKAFVNELLMGSPLHNEELIDFGKDKKMCSYELALALAKKANVVIGDYYYVFNPFVQTTLFTKLDLQLEDVILIVDEGHNLPARITDMLSNNLTSNMLRNGLIEAKKFSYHGLIPWLQSLSSILNQMADFPASTFTKEKLVTKEDFMVAVNEFVEYDKLINELELAADEIRKKQRRSFLGGLVSFLEAWKGDDEGFTRILSEQRSRQGPMTVLSYSCLDPAIVTENVFKSVHASVVMSGTLEPTFMYKDILGIVKGVQKEYESPFPLDNKLTLIVPQTTTKFNLRGETMYKQIAQNCAEISALIPGNVALFFPSYDLRDKICTYLTSEKTLFFERRATTKEEKEIFLARFKDVSKEGGGILLGVTGANFAEGIDFPGDLLKGVVVVGLPLARPDLKTKEIIRYYEQEFARGWDYGYIFPAMNKCFQSAGRCIRSETDKGVVVFLDERFTWPKYFRCFSKEGLRVAKDYKKLLKEFWKSED